MTYRRDQFIAHRGKYSFCGVMFSESQIGGRGLRSELERGSRFLGKEPRTNRSVNLVRMERLQIGRSLDRFSLSRFTL